MARHLTEYKILISSPSDVFEGHIILKNVVEEWNRMNENSDMRLKTIDWKNNAIPDSGQHPQSMLNEQLVNGCDIVIAIFNSKFGTPTISYQSGTEEEIRLALEPVQGLLRN